MSFEIIGEVDTKRIYCAGSFTKFMTTFVCLSFLNENYNLLDVLDDVNFFNSLCEGKPEAENFLRLFQQKLKNKFSLHDVCSFYSGLPYTFDITAMELDACDAGLPLKHHSILEEKLFLEMCRDSITPIFPVESKFLYSEISIIFLGYFIEKCFGLQIEELYQKYVIAPLKLSYTTFSRTRPANAYATDLSDNYDYPAIGILDHGYFAYSNGFFTNLTDTKTLLEYFTENKIFKLMTDIKHARAASSRLLNGLTVEIRQFNDDIICGYEGLSYSGCNIWNYSFKNKKGYITFTESEEDAYIKLYDNFGMKEFNKVSAESEKLYANYLQNYVEKINDKLIPVEYRGVYQRVKINEKELLTHFIVGENFIVIRNPEEVRYDAVYDNGSFHVLNRDKTHGNKIGLVKSTAGTYYMYFDGTLYRKISDK